MEENVRTPSGNDLHHCVNKDIKIQEETYFFTCKARSCILKLLLNANRHMMK